MIQKIDTFFFSSVQSIPVVFINTANNEVQMYVCIRSNTTPGSLYHNVRIIIKLHVTAFFHRAIVRLICEEMLPIQMRLRPI
jgi:hypothetical protein